MNGCFTFKILENKNLLSVIHQEFHYWIHITSNPVDHLKTSRVFIKYEVKLFEQFRLQFLGKCSGKAVNISNDSFQHVKDLKHAGNNSHEIALEL